MAASYSYQQIIDACDDTIYQLVVNRVASYTWLGRLVTYQNLKEIRETRAEYVALKASEDSGEAGGVALGVFGEPR